MTIQTNEPDIGRQLHDVLAAYREFIRSTHALMRCIESEMTRRGWTLLRPSGYAVTTNGYARGLASCTDWTPTTVAVAFVQGDVPLQGGVTVTPLAEQARRILAFQVRWLEAAAGEPVVWRLELDVSRSGEGDKWQKWEVWQQEVFNNIAKADARADGAFTVKPGTSKGGAVTVHYVGTGHEVPIAVLVDSDSVVRLLVEAGASLGPTLTPEVLPVVRSGAPA